jgi:hypothetical protein
MIPSSFQARLSIKKAGNFERHLQRHEDDGGFDSILPTGPDSLKILMNDPP